MAHPLPACALNCLHALRNKRWTLVQTRHRSAFNPKQPTQRANTLFHQQQWCCQEHQHISCFIVCFLDCCQSPCIIYFYKSTYWQLCLHIFLQNAFTNFFPQVKKYIKNTEVYKPHYLTVKCLLPLHTVHSITHVSLWVSWYNMMSEEAFFCKFKKKLKIAYFPCR